jgi:hypothetical protein
MVFTWAALLGGGRVGGCVCLCVGGWGVGWVGGGGVCGVVVVVGGGCVCVWGGGGRGGGGGGGGGWVGGGGAPAPNFQLLLAPTTKQLKVWGCGRRDGGLANTPPNSSGEGGDA